jgi:hypothetical protein
LSVCALELAGTAITLGIMPKPPMARKSRSAFQVMLALSSGATAWLGLTASRVYPSGVERATLSPDLFSTMTGWPSVFDIRSATTRVTESTTPPAEKGTMIRIGWSGKRAALSLALSAALSAA